MRLLILVLLMLTACGRPLTPPEKAFASQIHGDQIDTSRIRAVNGSLVGKITHRRDKRPRLACRERIYPEPDSDLVTVAPAAVVIHNRIFFSKNWYMKDYMHGYPDLLSLSEAMLFAHEITHVWQWQNRRATGYSPLRAAREHHENDDPYLYDISTKTRFGDYAFEQQASIVEEYVCCAALDPEAPRTKRLESLLKSAFPLQNLTIPDNLRIPWKDAKIKGICH